MYHVLAKTRTVNVKRVLMMEHLRCDVVFCSVFNAKTVATEYS